jgi:DNA polymerase-3 subunit alpha
MEFIYQKEELPAPDLRKVTQLKDDWNVDGPLPPEFPDDWHLSQPPELSLGGPASVGELPLAATTNLPAPAKEPAQRNELPAPDARREPATQPVSAALAAGLPQDVLKPVFVPVYYLVPPASIGASSRDSDRPRMIMVVLRSSGNRERDARRLKVVFGLMISSPGKDRFSFMVFEQDSRYILEFPNETTGISPELIRRLSVVVGEVNLRIEPIQIQ